MDAEKALNKNHHPFMITLKKLGKEDSSQLDREYLQNYTANMHNCKRFKKSSYLLLTLLINIVLEVCQYNKAKKGNKKHPDQKGRHETPYFQMTRWSIQKNPKILIIPYQIDR